MADSSAHSSPRSSISARHGNRGLPSAESAAPHAAADQANRGRLSSATATPAGSPPENVPTFAMGRFKIVAIGSSTGAPMLLEEMLSGLPADLSVPILVAQHLPPSFTASFAVQLDHRSPLTVVHAEDGMPLLPGTVYLGQGRKHLRLRKPAGARAVIEISSEPENLPFKPSVDELFQSTVGVFGSSILAIVMTGIGRDGCIGAGLVKRAGGMVLTQSAATCAVYGMPKACVDSGYSDGQLSPDGLRRAILQLSPSFGSP